MGVYQMLANTWTFDPFIDGDGRCHVRLGLWGDHGDYASVTASVPEIDRANRQFGDIAARLDEATRVADELVRVGTWDLADRDRFLKDRCLALMSRLDVGVEALKAQRADPA